MLSSRDPKIVRLWLEKYPNPRPLLLFA